MSESVLSLKKVPRLLLSRQRQLMDAHRERHTVKLSGFDHPTRCLLMKDLRDLSQPEPCEAVEVWKTWKSCCVKVRKTRGVMMTRRLSKMEEMRQY
jgi:hypothetical protein